MPESSFKTFLQNYRKPLTGSESESEKRLFLIENEAMAIAHRELENASLVALSFFPKEQLKMADLLHIQSMLAGLYPLALSELVQRGEIEIPVRTASATTPSGGPVDQGGN